MLAKFGNHTSVKQDRRPVALSNTRTVPGGQPYAQNQQNCLWCKASRTATRSSNGSARLAPLQYALVAQFGHFVNILPALQIWLVFYMPSTFVALAESFVKRSLLALCQDRTIAVNNEVVHPRQKATLPATSHVPASQFAARAACLHFYPTNPIPTAYWQARVIVSYWLY